MALTVFQTNVISYFSQNMDRFVEFLMSNSTQDIFEPTEISDEIIKFLENDFRLDLRKYPHASQARTRILDMLIEIKTNPYLKKTLMANFHTFFKTS